MKSEFDRKGFLFIIKFIGQSLALYFMTVFISNFVFSQIYDDKALVLVRSQENLAAVASKELPLNLESSKIVLGFVGDIMLDRGIEDVVLSHSGGDFKFIFDNVKNELSSLDLLFGNLEGPISDQGRDLGALYSFHMNPEGVNGLLYAGFDILSLANNHAGDWGEESLNDTINRLNGSGIKTIGAGFSREEAYGSVIVKVGGLKVAFLSFTESAGIYSGSNVAIATETQVRDGVLGIKETGLADLIVVHFHFGDEYHKTPNDKQKKLSRLAIDTGANLVVGSHPHVTQGFEKYKEGFIVYSLGNFVFDQNFSDETMRGWLLKVYIEGGGDVTGLELCEVFISILFQPSILACNTVPHL